MFRLGAIDMFERVKKKYVDSYTDMGTPWDTLREWRLDAPGSTINVLVNSAGEHRPCQYCDQVFKADRRGGCEACGAPRR